jgi:hypothetical protein
MASYEMKQGNSFWMDYTMRIKPSTKTIADIDPVWANFSATWRIEAATGEKALAGELTRATTAGVFNLRIGPISTVVGTGTITGDAAWWTVQAPLATPGWAALPVGTYALIIETKNTNVDFCFEDADDELTILEQDI